MKGREEAARETEWNKIKGLILNSVNKFNKSRVPLKQQRVSSFVSASPAKQPPAMIFFLLFLSFRVLGWVTYIPRKS